MSQDAEITLRPATPADLPFLKQVYASSRSAELAATAWTEAEKQIFCDEQFKAHTFAKYIQQPFMLEPRTVFG